MMRTSSRLLAMLLTGLSLGSAQETDEAGGAGFLNVVNLIGVKSPTYLKLGSFAIKGGKAVRPGENSGVLAIKPARYVFTLSNEAATPKLVSGDFLMETGKAVAIICYDEKKRYRDGSEEVKLRYTVLAESDGSGPRLSVVSLLRAPSLVIRISGKPVTLTARRLHPEKVALGDKIRLVFEGRTLAEFPIEKPVHYLGFLFENSESGAIELSLIENEKLEYQAPLEPEEAAATAE